MVLWHSLLLYVILPPSLSFAMYFTLVVGAFAVTFFDGGGFGISESGGPSWPFAFIAHVSIWFSIWLVSCLSGWLLLICAHKYVCQVSLELRQTEEEEKKREEEDSVGEGWTKTNKFQRPWRWDWSLWWWLYFRKGRRAWMKPGDLLEGV